MATTFSAQNYQSLPVCRRRYIAAHQSHVDPTVLQSLGAGFQVGNLNGLKMDARVRSSRG